MRKGAAEPEARATQVTEDPPLQMTERQKELAAQLEEPLPALPSPALQSSPPAVEQRGDASLLEQVEKTASEQVARATLPHLESLRATEAQKELLSAQTSRKGEEVARDISLQQPAQIDVGKWRDFLTK